MSEELWHFSDNHFDLSLLEPRSQIEEPDYKPRGFWVSVEDGYGWHWWTEAEAFERGRRSYKVALHPDANILRVMTVTELDAFNESYKSLQDFGMGPGFSRNLIRWADVAAAYQGVLIAPYQWSRRLHLDTKWYNTWDCSSGCIWDPAAIAEIVEAEFEPLIEEVA